jgi:NADPH:quinone reductase-like Zn-dependent oxidoreductase/NAD(P)-dependent dehydrogenase (short-subunit alcohol dehydrogenase family)/ubiquinone/menaquinone biosynthesis C-methylase UbiE
MLAVGLGRTGVQPYLSRVATGRISIACVNSPQSTTISGDECAIDELKALLDIESIFARKLRVDQAYHSHHMQRIAATYHAACEQTHHGRAREDVAFFSTVTGTRKNENFGASYWVDNLVSPVEFVTGLQLVRDEMKAANAGRKDGYVFVEIGPSGALAGPAKQTLASSEDFKYTYLSPLVRQTDALQSTLTLIGRLVELGVPVNRKKLSSMVSSSQSHIPNILNSLKAYPFAEDSGSFWRESRLSSAHRFRQFPWNDLCGLLDPACSEQEPRWRHFLNMNSLPWMKDHVIDGSIIFPASGYLAMAIEAVKQLLQLRKNKAVATGVSDSVKNFAFKDVKFIKAISIPEDDHDADIELQLTLSPSQELTGRWLTFRVLTFSNDTWDEACNGLVSYETDKAVKEVENIGDRDVGQAATLATFHDIQTLCTSHDEIVAKDEFYRKLDMHGNKYGSSFALLHDLHLNSTGTMACTKLTVPNMTEHMPGYVPQPHLIHPSTLDAISHIGAQLFQKFNNNAPVVIGGVASMKVTATDCSRLCKPGTELFIAAALDRALTDTQSCITDAYVFEKNEVTGEFSLALQSQYVLRSFGSGQALEQNEEKSQSKQPRQFEWKVDVDSLRSDEFLNWVNREQCHPTKDTNTMESFTRDHQRIEQAAYIFMRHALSKLNMALNTSGTVTPPSITEPHLDRLFSWMQKCSTSPELHSLTADLSFEDEARIVQDAENSPNLRFEGMMVAKIGRKLADVLLGKCDAAGLLDEASLPDDLYNSSLFSTTFQHMVEYLRLLSFKKPHMRVLELGAGAGGATGQLLQALKGEDGSIWLDRYTCTDKSGDSLEQAKSNLSEWVNYVDFKTLDVDAELAKQGFEAQSYDAVVISNVVLSGNDMSSTLASAHKLLRPGGKLMTAALTEPSVAVDMVFGILPSWRADEDEPNRQRHLLKAEQWDELLRRKGFSGLEICVQGRHGLNTGSSSLMVSSALIEQPALPHKHISSPSSPLDGITIVQGCMESKYIQVLTRSLLDMAEEKGHQRWTYSKSIEDAAAMEPWNAAGPVMIIDVAERSLLLTDDNGVFESMRRLLTSGLSVIWVSLQESKADATVMATRSMIQGAARVLRRENGATSRLVTIDIEETTELGDDHVVSQVCRRLLEGAQSSLSAEEESYERELRYSNGKLLIPRLVTDTKFEEWADRVCAGSSSKTAALESDVPYHQLQRPLKLEVGTPGLLSSLRFVDDPASNAKIPLQPWEIEVSARAHGVNFKDVFVALGQMRAGVNMVGEVSGVVTAVGEDMVSRYRPGDRIFGFGASPFASKPRISGNLAHTLSSGMSFSDGAAISVVYATAYYSLFNAAKFRRGQSILIAAASGGVGQAAIQLAQHAGASEIFVTVGSKAKRKLIMDSYGIPESHVFSSRGPGFKDGILQLTKGRGVDCVLNSLSGEMLSGAFDCLAKLGSFVEIGKTDIYRNSHIEMKNFDKSLTFACVDLVVLGKEQPDLVYETLSSVSALLEKGAIKAPVPVNTLAIGRIEDAFRLIGTRKHTGKIVLESPPDATVTATRAPAPPLELSSDGTYVVGGGLGDLGRRLAAFMSAHGAGHVMLLSRRSITGEDLNAIQEQCGNKCVVHVVKCDVTKESDLQTCLQICRQENLPPVRGVVHAGMVLRDRPFAAMSREDFSAALGPKVLGTINLDRAFSSAHLDFFVTLSSVANHMGNGSQANYAAANEFQDAFARAHGSDESRGHTQYVSIDLGAVAGSDAVTKLASSSRLDSVMVSFDDVFTSIRYAMSPQARIDSCSQSILGLSRQGLTEVEDYVCLTNPLFSRLPYPAQLQGDDAGLKSNDKSNDIDKMLRQVGTIKEAEALIQDTITAKCAVFLDRPIDDVPVNQPLAMIGLDSLVSIELKNWLIRALQASVQASDISSAPSIAALAVLVTKKSNLVTDELKAATEDARQTGNGTSGPATSEQSSVAASLPSHGFNCCRASNDLPKYPLVELEETMSYLEQNVSRFAKNGDELRGLQQAVREFTAPGSIGQQLHSRLREKANNPEVDSWLADVHLKGLYLSRRHPLAPWGNFLNTHYDSPLPHGQAERAALVSTVAFQFQKEVVSRSLGQDWLGSRPICSYSWDWIFNTVREPQPGCDEMRKYPGNDYCAVLRKGHLFTVPLRHEGQDVSLERLRDTFQDILDHTQLDEDCWAGILTSDFRDPWAENREALMSLSETNREYLNAIERASFVVCLDDGHPVTNEQRVRQCYVGNGFNRWHDKATQFLISANGRSAQLSEHSMVDGLTLVRMTERIHDTIQSHVPSATPASAATGSNPVPFTRFTLQTTPAVEARMVELRTVYARETAKKKYTLHTIPSLGIAATLGSGLTAKACVDMAIQLANRIHFGYNPGSWEPVSTQHFHRGRPELVQVVTDSVVGFCEAALELDPTVSANPNDNKAALKQRLSTAAVEWDAQVRRAGEGGGFLRMWDTMGGMLPEGTEKPAIFTDPVFWRAFPGRVLQVRNEAEVEDAALCLYEEDALWMSYAIRENKVHVSVTGGVDKVDAYCEALNKAGEIIRSII